MQVFRFSCFHICLIGILYNLYFGLSIPFLYFFENYFFENVHFYTVKETLRNIFIFRAVSGPKIPANARKIKIFLS